MKSLSDIEKCPQCGSNEVYPYFIDEVEFTADGTGHYYEDYRCAECDKNFRLCMEFKYQIKKSWIK